MKNVTCPISNNKVPKHLPRVIAFYNILLMSLYMYQPHILILLIIAVDFLLRGFGYQQYSILRVVAIKTSNILKLKSPAIDKAPKLFAARLGAFMFIGASGLYLIGALNASFIVVGMVAFLATLEGVFSFCVGCYIYTYLVLPAYKQTK
ncbi:MAG: DUF4395 domain-containing protein [Salinivirgaceae bacterium]|jgi:hypothetical protein|nr:DUF4395 domain-containing protein [Salinivirgaceae bacterium]